MPDKKDNRKQIEKFRDAARELECNESEKDFDRKLKKIATKPPNKKRGK